MWGATCSANPLITPSGSLSRSKRETCSTIGSGARSGRSSSISARRSTRSGVPSIRWNVGATFAAPSWLKPATSRIAATISGSSSAFLGENASITGAISSILASSSPSHTKARRENT